MLYFDVCLQVQNEDIELREYNFSSLYIFITSAHKMRSTLKGNDLLPRVDSLLEWACRGGKQTETHKNCVS